MLTKVPNFKETIEIWQIDLADFESVKAFAGCVNRELDRVDIFVANTGIAAETWRITKDGYQEVLQINVIATGLL